MFQEYRREEAEYRPRENRNVAKRSVVLDLFHPAVSDWFRSSFDAPTPPQQGWPAIARGESTLILAPTGSGKTLTAFLWAINRVMFSPTADEPAASAVSGSRRASALARRTRGADHGSVSARVLYISPLK